MSMLFCFGFLFQVFRCLVDTLKNVCSFDFSVNFGLWCKNVWRMFAILRILETDCLPDYVKSSKGFDTQCEN